MPACHRRAALLPALSVLLGLAAASLAPPAGAAEEGPGETPVPRALTADGRPAEVADVLKYCGTKRNACTFAIDRKLGREYVTTMKSLGNAVINCTQSDMAVERTVTLKTGTTDNIGGEISGQITAEGTVGATGTVSTNLTGEVSSENKTPDLDKGPTSTNTAKTSVAGGATASGSLSARLAFQAAFKATYSKSWTVENTEETAYKTTVKAHDMLVFGASAAMRRVAGSLVADTGQRIIGIVVDSPSMVTNSTFIAQTYAAAAGVCGGTRPTGNTAPTPAPGPGSAPVPAPGPGPVSAAEVPVARAVPPGAEPKRVVVLPAAN
ncbi:MULTISPECIES: hypothetical protein [unclassified Streptomyces]|uniref:hypothetical protein n=1 Tax=unclassified Streptomyces TaxID=2593676 RepID=UPI001E3DB5B6|nr:hypothetical protein [Streptomyces sp. CB02980]MCB8907095.1 hypothetical protein [Streptomyces sp. CB02980]